MSVPSLRRALAWRFGLLALALLLSFWLVNRWGIAHMVERFVRVDLVHDHQTLEGAFDPVKGLDEKRLPPVYFSSRSGHAFEIQTPNMRYRSPGLGEGFLPKPPPNQQIWEGQKADGQGGRIQYFGERQTINGVPVIITVAEPVSHLEDELSRMAQATFLLIAGIFMALLFLGHRMLDQLFANLAKLRTALGALRRGEETSLAETETPEEVRPLFEEVQRLQGVLEERLKRSRTSMADLAHALKTPLAQLHHQAEQQSALPSEEVRPLLQALQRTLDHALRRASMAGDVTAERRCKPAEDFPLLLQLFEHRLGRDYALTLTIAEGVTTVPVDREDLLEFLGNLLENATKWAKGAIHLSVDENDEAVSFCVEDDGPGFPQGQEALLKERGLRADQRTPGQGLGLAIVAEGVALYGGQLTLGRSAKLGGAQVCLTFPEHGEPTRRRDA